LTQDDSNDHAINTQDTSHDDRNERLHNDGRSPDRDAADTCTGFGSTICSAEVFIAENLLARMRATVTPIKPKKEDPSLKGSGVIA
jgi:hypothetical protein